MSRTVRNREKPPAPTAPAHGDTHVPNAPPTAQAPSNSRSAVALPVVPPGAEPETIVTAARKVSDSAEALTNAAGDFAVTTEKLKDLEEGYRKVIASLADVDAAVRAKVTDDAYLKDIGDLLAVAALSESLREWFPVDPEMTSVRGTVLVPQVMAQTKPEAPKTEKPEDQSLDVLLKRLLAHLAK